MGFRAPLDERGYRRNFLAFTFDMLTFGIAMAFISRSTVLPSLVRRLTDSAPLVGLVETVCNGAWLIPQLLAARFLHSRSRRKRYITRPILVQRLMFLVMPPLVLLLAPSHPAVVVTVLFVVLALFHSLDAIASVAWFDLMTLSVPAAPRARLIGLGQLLSGVAGMVCGLVVSRILGAGGPGWVTGYALLFGLAGVAFLLGLIALFSLEDRPGHVAGPASPPAEYLRAMLTHLKTDHLFRRVVVVRLLVGFAGLSTPFYILYALDGLGLGSESIGFFTAANLGGGILSSLVMARLSSRRGTRSVIRFSALLALTAPLVALTIMALRPMVPAAALRILLAAVFVAMGALANGGFAGFINYILESSPPEHRTTYVGLANTLNGVVLVLPVLGGWILQGAGFGALFGVTAAVAVAGVAGSVAMTEPRKGPPA